MQVTGTGQRSQVSEPISQVAYEGLTQRTPLPNWGQNRMANADDLGDLLERLNEHPTDLRVLRESSAHVPEVKQFVERVANVLTTLDQAITKMGVKEALHVLQIRRLTELMDAQNEDIQRLGTGVEDLAQGVTRVAQDTHEAAEAAALMKEAGSQSLQRLDEVLGSVGSLEVEAREAQQTVANLVEETRTAAEGLKAIRGVAATSQLLALNAAIQAAHASDKAFAVVAQEMRRLADRTEHLGKQIETQVAGMEGAIAAAATAMKTMAERAAQTGSKAREASGGLTHVQELLNNVSDSVQSIAAVAEEQAAATEEMSATAQDLGQRVKGVTDSLSLTRNLGISEVTEQAQAALGQFRIGSQADRVRTLVDQAASRVESTVESLLDRGAVGRNDLWDYNYQEIKGSQIASLGRLFRVDRVPPEGFVPPKYRTAYDQKIDQPLIDLMDKVIAEGGLQFCTVLDLNAFTIAHGRNMVRDWTGDHEQDLRGNRIKRLFTADPNARKAARVSLPAHLADRERITERDLAATPGPEGNRPFLLQTYALDSGDVVLALSMPLYIQGRRWGTIRVGYNAAV